MATTVNDDSRSAKELALEKKYIALLEQRIKMLEEKLPTKKPEGHRLRSLSIATEADADAANETTILNGMTDGARIQYRMKRYNNDGFMVEETYDPKRLEGSKPPDSNSAATVMLYFDRKKNHIETEIKIESSAVRAIFHRELKHYPGYHWENPRLSIYAPFAPILHNWDRLTKAAESYPGDQGCDDLKEVLNAVKSSKEVKEYFENRESMDETVTFDFLWTIFPPGERVLLPNSFMRHPQVFIVREAVEHQNPRDNRKKYLMITCWAYDWDGSRCNFNRVSVNLKIEFYKGRRLITSLPCFPWKYYDPQKRDEVEKMLINRGKRFRNLCMRPRGRQMFDYEGLAYLRGTGVRQVVGQTQRSGGSGDDMSIISHLTRLSRLNRSSNSELTAKSGRQLNMKGRVMVDFESYVRHGPNEPVPIGELTLSDKDEDDECRCTTCMADGGPKDNQKYEWDANSGEGKDSFNNDQYLTCPPRVLGYHLMEKKWVELLINHVHDIEKPLINDAFQKLQLAERQKVLIQELVRSHTNDRLGDTKSPRAQMDDLTKGKGEGLVILLHGPPGVGKTLTAESVAQVTGKPLFPMGVGDVTTDPSLVEKRLEQMFELAEAWQAVMLFDEADVFLESRAATTDVTRVGLVSVLLRVLEYYHGILILTTNRIRSFDIAVQSRINLAIQFKDLTERQKSTIFKNLVNQLDEDFVENKHELVEWIREDDEANTSFSGLNGRQVRNIVFSAASLAGNRPVPDNILKKDDVKRMLAETVSFQQHLQELTKAAREKNE